MGLRMWILLEIKLYFDDKTTDLIKHKYYERIDTQKHYYHYQTTTNYVVHKFTHAWRWREAELTLWHIYIVTLTLTPNLTDTPAVNRSQLNIQSTLYHRFGVSNNTTDRENQRQSILNHSVGRLRTFSPFLGKKIVVEENLGNEMNIFLRKFSPRKDRSKIT